jgi:uncharacterized membrane protein
MASLVVLAGTWVVLRLAGLLGWELVNGWEPALTGALAAMFVLTSSAHFVGKRKAGLIAMVPTRLPRPDILVAVTGVLELLGAVGLLVPATHVPAALCLALLLVVMFPANVRAARSRIPLGGRPPTPLALRSAMQALYVAACLAVAIA